MTKPIATKPFWKSKTFWGIIITVASTIAKQYNIELPMAADATTAQAIGAGLAAWGIRTSKTPIRKINA